MRGGHNEDYETGVPIVRYILIYIWLIVLFGEIVLIVQASMDIKKMGYALADKVEAKIDLLNEIQQRDNEISQMESYQRISELIAVHRPELGPPRHPAIEIRVAGLAERSGLPPAVVVIEEDRGLLDTLRQHWKTAQTRMSEWIQGLLE